MINRIVILVFILVVFLACNSKNQNATYDVLTVNQLMDIAIKSIDHEVMVSGMVNHVCSHSGRRCFIVDSTGDFTIRVEAAGSIEKFDKELIGSTIKVRGILKETRLLASEIDEMEQEHISEHPEEAEAPGEHCSAEMTNINKMREWMKINGKDYYSIFYLEGINYELVE
jgi:hypothetical protein